MKKQRRFQASFSSRESGRHVAILHRSYTLQWERKQEKNSTSRILGSGKLTNEFGLRQDPRLRVTSVNANRGPRSDAAPQPKQAKFAYYSIASVPIAWRCSTGAHGTCDTIGSIEG